jgi:hypothetical protein
LRDHSIIEAYKTLEFHGDLFWRVAIEEALGQHFKLLCLIIRDLISCKVDIPLVEVLEKDDSLIAAPFSFHNVIIDYSEAR